MSIRTKRIYDPAADEDGYRVLVDRMWPRGVSKANAKLDEWLKDIAPSNELRRWFGHDRERWQEFYDAYEKELAACDHEIFEGLLQHAAKDGLTLLFAARDTECNNAVVLKNHLENIGK